MQEISISEFRQRSVTLIDRLPPEGVVITRRGVPIARLVPVRPASCADLIGSISILTDSADDLFSTGERQEPD